jgi:hypothetical protein
MSKWKAPENAGPSVSVGGQTFNIVDGVVELPDGEFGSALIPFGFEPIPTTEQEAAEAEAKRLAAEEEARIAAEEAAAAKEAEEAVAAEAAAKEEAEKKAAEEAAAAEAAKTSKKK